jgi:hypothetical protein
MQYQGAPEAVARSDVSAGLAKGSSFSGWHVWLRANCEHPGKTARRRLTDRHKREACVEAKAKYSGDECGQRAATGIKRGEGAVVELLCYCSAIAEVGSNNNDRLGGGMVQVGTGTSDAWERRYWCHLLAMNLGDDANIDTIMPTPSTSLSPSLPLPQTPLQPGFPPLSDLGERGRAAQWPSLRLHFWPKARQHSIQTTTRRHTKFPSRAVFIKP